VLGVKEEEEEEEELIVAVAVATARIIMCARYVSAFARYNRYYIDIPDWIKRGPLKERESAILLFGLFSVRAIRLRRKEEEEYLYLVRRLSLCVCLSVLLCFLFLFASARRRRVVRVCAGAFLLLLRGKKCNCGLGFRV